MKVKLRLLNPLRQRVGESEIEMDFQGGSIEAFLRKACENYPALGNAIISKEGSIDYSVNVVVNGTPLTETGMKDDVNEGDEIVLMMAVAGG